MLEESTVDVSSFSTLKSAVDRASDYFLQNKICRALDDGQLTTDHYARLLSALYYQVDASSASLVAAAASCAPSEWSLRRYLLKYAEEEKSHTDWIAMDLRALGRDGAPTGRWPSPDVAAYIAYNHCVAQRSPLGRLAIALTLETLCARLGLLYAERLRQALNLSSGRLSFLLGNPSSDVEHVRELKEIIEATAVRGDWKWLSHVARTAAALYRVIYDNVEI